MKQLKERAANWLAPPALEVFSLMAANGLPDRLEQLTFRQRLELWGRGWLPEQYAPCEMRYVDFRRLLTYLAEKGI